MQMWVLGTLIFYLFYRVGIVWYLGMFTKGPTHRPLGFGDVRFHYGVRAVSAALLIASGFCYYLTYPWLAIVPIPLCAFSLMVLKDRQLRKFNGIISRAVETQVKLERLGRPQDEINRAIYLEATGNPYRSRTGFDRELDFKSFLRFCVFSELMSLDFNDWQQSIKNPNYVSTEDRFNATVDFYYGAMSRLQS